MNIPLPSKETIIQFSLFVLLGVCGFFLVAMHITGIPDDIRNATASELFVLGASGWIALLFPVVFTLCLIFLCFISKPVASILHFCAHYYAMLRERKSKIQKIVLITIPLLYCGISFIILIARILITV